MQQGGAALLIGGAGLTTKDGGAAQIIGGDSGPGTGGRGGTVGVFSGAGVGTDSGSGDVVLGIANVTGSGAIGTIRLLSRVGDTKAIETIQSFGANGATVGMFVGTRDPSALVTGDPGDVYYRDSTTSSGIYVNTGSGAANTTWTKLGTFSLQFTPNTAEFPSTNFPQLTTIHSTARRPVLAFDAGTDETAYWTFAAPANWSSTLKVRIYYAMASATTNSVVWTASVEAITDGDSTDLDAAESFDTANAVTDAVPATTAGKLGVAEITLTNHDSSASGDYVRLKVTRDADNASDNATGDAYLLHVELHVG